MRPHLRIVAAAAACWIAPNLLAQEASPAPGELTYDRDVQPILRKRCGTCHGQARPRGELDLLTFAALNTGGASGKVAVPGVPEDSPLYTYTAHVEDPFMPPNAPKIPQREVDTIRRWIEGGMKEKVGDGTRSKDDATPGEPPLRGLVAPKATARPAAITALDITPDGDMLATSGHFQILVFDMKDLHLHGALAFPEGNVRVLKFDRSGETLLAAGGLGATSGKVVRFRTGTWERLAALGDEADEVLAADLAPDSSRLVLGGPERIVKVLALPQGTVEHTFQKPTDWVTAASFSPDGLLMAAGDRFGGLFLWEAGSGKEFLSLRSHTKALSAIAWPPGADEVVTAGQDGDIQVWDLHTGKSKARWTAHDRGAQALAANASGRLASTGRDRRLKVWDRDGSPIADLGPLSDEGTGVAWTADGRSLVSGDWSGDLRLWDIANGTATKLTIPVTEVPATVSFVRPELVPARPFQPAAPKTGTTSENNTTRDPTTALAAAEEAARLAERTVTLLRGPSGARGDGLQLELRKARTALQAALASDPANRAIRKALDETKRALQDLDEKGEAAPR